MSAAADQDGHLYLLGNTEGTFPGEQRHGDRVEIFLRKYDVRGTALWTRQFGTGEGDFAGSVTVDRLGNVYLAGSTSGTMPSQLRVGGTDAFLSKLDPDGKVLWTRQFGTATVDRIVAIAVDHDDHVYVAGTTEGALPGQRHGGILPGWTAGRDAFVRKYDAHGQELWTRQFGGADMEYGSAVGADDLGNVYVAGWTGGPLPGETSAGSVDSFVRSYDAEGALRWTHQFGTPWTEKGQALAFDREGYVYVGGQTHSDFVTQQRPSSNNCAPFVRKLDGTGKPIWTRQFDTFANQWEMPIAMALDGDGRVHLTSQDPDNGITIRTYDGRGVLLQTRQLRAAGPEYYTGAYAYSMVALGNGLICLAGSTSGRLPGETPSGANDAFVACMTP